MTEPVVLHFEVRGLEEVAEQARRAKEALDALALSIAAVEVVTSDDAPATADTGKDPAP